MTLRATERAIATADRRLILMRHAKSAWSTGDPDHDRPLSGRGRRDARVAGAWLTEHGLVPDLVLVSSATRTRQTLAYLSEGGGRYAASRVVPELYEAGEDAVAGVIAATGDAVRTLLVIGHNPGVEDAVRLLARRVGNYEWWAAMDEKFPTSAIAVVGFDGTWGDVEPGVGALLAYAVPRG